MKKMGVLLIGMFLTCSAACGSTKSIWRADAAPVVETSLDTKLHVKWNGIRLIDIARGSHVQVKIKEDVVNETENINSSSEDSEIIEEIRNMFKAARGEITVAADDNEVEAEESLIGMETEDQITGNIDRENAERIAGEIAINEEQHYNYVALGNSVTCNAYPNPEGIWWSDWGMAATSEDKDYVHIVSSWLSGQMSKKVNVVTADLKPWEIAQNRNSILFQYDALLNDETDLVTIQTGENITDNKSNLKGDYNALFSYIRSKAPKAQILVIGELLWPSDDIEDAKRAACEQNGLTFVEVGEFLGGYDNNYRSSMGTMVAGNDGKQYTIQNEIVAAHPNDEGMAKIAQLVIGKITLKQENTQ